MPLLGVKTPFFFAAFWFLWMCCRRALWLDDPGPRSFFFRRPKADKFLRSKKAKFGRFSWWFYSFETKRNPQTYHCHCSTHGAIAARCPGQNELSKTVEAARAHMDALHDQLLLLESKYLDSRNGLVCFFSFF